jgi:hypothetical protein
MARVPLHFACRMSPRDVRSAPGEKVVAHTASPRERERTVRRTEDRSTRAVPFVTRRIKTAHSIDARSAER